MQDVKIFESELSEVEISILAEKGSIQTFTTGINPVPPLIEVRLMTGITDSNATLNYELLSFDEVNPPSLDLLGLPDRSDNEGLWENNASLGQRGMGEGGFSISGLEAGETVYYNVRAKGATYSDWSDLSGKSVTVSLPNIVSLPANEITTSSASLHGNLLSNGGVVKKFWYPQIPGVAEGLVAHWKRLMKAQGKKHMIQQDLVQRLKYSPVYLGKKAWAGNGELHSDLMVVIRHI